LLLEKKLLKKVESILKSKGLFAEPIGELIEKSETPIYINDKE